MSCAAGSSVVAVQATQASMCLLARQMLCGVLASFRYEESDLDNASLPFQSCCITNIVWEYCKRQMECHIDSPKLQLVQVFRTVRAVLLVVDNRTGRELVQEILTFAQVLNPLGDDGSISPCMRSIWPVQVREGILAYLPLAHIVRDGSEDTVLMLRHVAQKSVQEIERFGGAAAGAASSTGFVAHGEGVAQVWDGIQVGSALSVLVATAGFHSSARGAAEALQRVHSCWRECLESLRGNVFVGTSLLRWISSLSEHIQTLALAGDDRASGGGVGGKGGAGLNIARVQRVSSVAAVLTALVRCLWSHSVPRAVQQVLSKAAASCCEAVHRLLAVQPSASRHGSDQVLVSNTAVQLMEFITTTMKVVVGPNFSEKSIEVGNICLKLNSVSNLT